MGKVMSNQTTLSKISEPIRILRNIRETIPEAIIAGGYHRDLYHDKRVSDVDIFISNFPNEDENLAMDIFDDSFWIEQFNLNIGSFLSMDNIRALGKGDEDYDGIPWVSGVYEICKNERKYNVIIVDAYPIEYVEKHFDFDLCKVYCDGQKVTFTKEFITDSQNKTITYSTTKATQSLFDRSMEFRYPKIKKKYPEFELQIVEDSMKFLQQTPVPNARIIRC
jgi:hypothetical protein